MGGDPFSPVFPLNQHTLSVRAHLDVLGIWASLWFKICETLYRELEILLIDNKFLPCIGFVACLYCCVCVCVFYNKLLLGSYIWWVQSSRWNILMGKMTLVLDKNKYIFLFFFFLRTRVFRILLILKYSLRCK